MTIEDQTLIMWRELGTQRVAPDVIRTQTVSVLVPARNEEESIAATVRSIQDQTYPVDRILVVVNNTTDATELCAKEAGAEVLNVGLTPFKKAGAINAGLDQILPYLNDDDTVIIQDADTLLNPQFVETALAYVNKRRIGGVCAQYDSPPAHNLIERLQSNEFARSRRSTDRRGGDTKILVGIASMFRADTLRQVQEARTKGLLTSNTEPTVYDNYSLTEDYELTLALRTLGYRFVCPENCRPQTHAMPTVRKLWGQRVRWGRGGLDDLHEYGITDATRPYVWAQVGRLIMMLMPLLYIAYLVVLQSQNGRIVWALPWFAINLIFLSERVITVKSEGWRPMLLAALLIPELIYDWFMSAAYITGLIKHLRGRVSQWLET